MKLRDRAQRRSARLLVSFWRPRRESDYHEGRIVDVSATGCFIATKSPFPPPTSVVLRLVLGDERLDIRGEVVRTVGDVDSFRSGQGSGMAVRFQHPGSDRVRQLTEHRKSRADEHSNRSRDR
ncbi:MAG: PilZ domain-containing protein [Thermoanaerobaculia bacterium]|nr:PilZ domain-containing protein [Thermoanaerobaculia bacterium]